MSEPTVEHKPKQKRYEAIVDGEVAGYIAYERIADAIDLQHTVVEPHFEGRGIGSTLARAAMDDIRSTGGLSVIPTCPFVARWLGKHEEYADLRHRPQV
ncbi:MAG: GNAT family N-acetyltransferase [Propionibacteriaceae bacterium]|nr:GNAT family N-acetyltransferase [Propionibacteriaceae bacterium]